MSPKDAWEPWRRRSEAIQEAMGASAQLNRDQADAVAIAGFLDALEPSVEDSPVVTAAIRLLQRAGYSVRDRDRG